MGSVEGCWPKGTTFGHRMSKFQGANVQRGDTVNNTVSLEVTKRGDLKCSHHKKETAICNVMEVLANALVIIILQNTSASYQHSVQLQLIGCYVCQLYLNKSGKLLKKTNGQIQNYEI